MSDSSLLQRLKERKIVQWAVAYLCGAWILVEATNLVVEQFFWPLVVGQLVTILAFFGFFVVLVLAWFHGERGSQRVSALEVFTLAALLGAAGVAVSRIEPRNRESPPEALYPPAADDDRPAIAVLPCENFSPDPDDAYFAAGIHEEILLRLSKISSLRSVGRETVEWYRDNPVPVRRMARELGVGFVGECSVRKDVEGNRIRLTFQLIEGDTGAQLWAESYDENLSARNVFDIHSQLALRVADAVGAELTPEDQVQVAARPTGSLEAYNLYLMGRLAWNRRTGEGLETARHYFDQAREADSTFVLAYVGLADTYVLLPWYSNWATDKAYPEAIAAAEKALKLDPLSGEARTSLAYAILYYDWDFQRAEAEFARAIQLSPNHATAHHWYGVFLSIMGRFEEAISEVRIALALDPLSAIASENLGDLLYYAGRYDEAIAQYQRTQELHPGFSLTLRGLGRAFIQKGLYEEAEATFKESSEEYPMLARVYDATGRRDAALAVLEAAEEGPLLAQAEARIGVGDLDGAMEVLENAYDQREVWLLEYPNLDPYYDTLRSDPRFIDLLRRIGLSR